MQGFQVGRPLSDRPGELVHGWKWKRRPRWGRRRMAEGGYLNLDARTSRAVQMATHLFEVYDTVALLIPGGISYEYGAMIWVIIEARTVCGFSEHWGSFRILLSHERKMRSLKAWKFGTERGTMMFRAFGLPMAPLKMSLTMAHMQVPCSPSRKLQWPWGQPPGPSRSAIPPTPAAGRPVRFQRRGRAACSS